MAEPARKIYDDENQADEFVPQPRFGVIKGGGETTDPKRGHLKAVGDDKPKGLKDSEEAGLKDAYGSKAVQDEQKALDDSGATDLSDDEFFKDDDEVGPDRIRGLRGWKRKAAAGGLAGLLGGGIVTGMFLFASGPLQFLHFAQLLQQFHFGNSDDFTNGRSAKLIQYARNRHNPERRNLDYFGDKIADRYTTRLRDAGIEYEYRRSRISAITIDPTTEEGQRAIRALEAEDFVIPDPEGGRVRVELVGERAKLRRVAIGTSVGALGMNGVSNSIAGRLLKIRGGVNFHPLQNIAKAADERLFRYIDSIRNRDADYIRNGTSSDLQVRVGDTPDATDGDAPPPTATADANGAADAGNGGVRVANAPGTPVRVRSNLFRTGALTAAGVGGLASLTCGLQQLGEAAGEVQNSNIIKPLIRNGMQIISVGAQIQSGQDVNFDELGALQKSLYDDVGKTSWVESKSIQNNLGNEGGVEIVDSAVPGVAKPLFFEQLDGFLNAIPRSAEVCDAVTSTAGNIILTVTDIAFGASGPFGLLLAGGSELGSTLLTNAFTDDLVRWIAGEQIATDVAGAMFGNFADAGAFLANNDRMWSLGGRFLNPLEVGQLKQQRVAEREKEMQQKSFFARVLDFKEPNSVASKTILENPTFASASTSNMTNTLVQAPMQSVASVFKNFSTIMTPRSLAQEREPIPVDYGVPEVGYSAEEINSEIAEDPYENASYVEANIEDLNDRYGECYNTEIDPVSGTIETNDVAGYIGRPEACNDTSEDHLRFRYYLSDMTIAQTLTCYAGNDEESCANLGFETETDDTAGGPLPDGVVGIEDIVDIPPWLGLGRGCHESIAARTREMFVAADAAGVTLRGNCWRSSEVQAQLRQANCPDPVNSPSSDCDPPTAPVGSSNHERGLAIDFSDCSSGSACFNWLSANAATYGFQNLPSESWHWSVDGT